MTNKEIINQSLTIMQNKTLEVAASIADEMGQLEKGEALIVATRIAACIRDLKKQT